MSIVGATICSIFERALRSIIWINSLDQIFTEETSTWIDMGYQFAVCSGLLAVRYIICSKRHYLAYYSGFLVRNQTLNSIQKRWLCSKNQLNTNRNDIYEYSQSMKVLGNYIESRQARIATDMVPGTLSICIGIFQLIYYIDAPVSYACIGYLFVLEYLYITGTHFNQEREEELTKQVHKVQSKMYSTVCESIQNREMILSMERVEYESEIFKELSNSSFLKEIDRARVDNILSSMIHWMSHLVYIGILVLSRHHISKDAHMLWVLYFSKEIRSGCQEIHYFMKVSKKTQLLTQNIERMLDYMENEEDIHQDDMSNFKQCTSVQLQSISLSYGTVDIFKEVSFSKDVFQKNSYTILMGKNGTGKSSLCKILSGYLSNVRISNDGFCIVPPAHHTIICEQSPLLFESRSCLYNIAYGTDDIYKKGYLKNITFYEEISKNIGLEKWIKTDIPVSNLSGGERQKICILRAYIRAIHCQGNTDLLILDEWDSALDLASRKRGLKMIKDICDSTHCAVVWVCHREIPELLNDTSAKGILLQENGEICEGTYYTIWNKYQNL